MSINSIEKRIDKLEERLAPNKNRPFLLSDLSEEDAADLVRLHKSGCGVFFREFGGKCPVEPGHDLPIHKVLEYWAQRSVDILISFLSALARGDKEMIENARSLPELKPWVEWTENCVNKRRRSGIGL